MVKPAKKTQPSDALVVFGITGDLAHKKIFPALYAMVKRDGLNVPVLGVASSGLTLAQLRKRATASIREAGGIDDKAAMKRFLALLGYVQGDYNDEATFDRLRRALA